MEDGDIIDIDLENRSLHVELSDEVIAERLKKVKKPYHPADKIMKQYRSGVGSASEGAFGFIEMF